jgi:hypothetical protein
MSVFQLFGVVLVAIFAFGSIAVSTASAEPTLLAEWLIGSSAVTRLTPIETESFLILEDADTGARVACSIIVEGSVGPSGEGENTEALTKGGVLVTLSAPLLCESDAICEESATDIEVVPELSPWHFLLYLIEGSGKYRTINKSLITYVVTCLVLGLKITDECSAQNSTVEMRNVTGGVEFVGATSPRGTCSMGGPESGDINYISGSIMRSLTGSVLTVSSE